jgi:hypothetical protein
MSKPKLLILWCLAVVLSGDTVHAGEKPIDIFGYYQTNFEYRSAFRRESSHNTFNLQQLNMMFRKQIADRRVAFVNFEILNSYSSERNWGSLRLEEAWVRFRWDARLNLKLGLQIPIFNNLNEIRNRSPLLPYIVRPLVYEKSLSEVVGLDLFVPDQAFVQVYGFLPAGSVKLDYAAYVGNSPNVNGSPVRGQSGIDTTGHVLVGGRLGLRVGELKTGFSGTFTRDNELVNLEKALGGSADRFAGLNEFRTGWDLSYNAGPFMFEGEFIGVSLEERAPELHVDQQFYYGTLGYHISERLLFYGSYWVLKSAAFDLELAPGQTAIGPTTRVVANEEIIDIPTVGISFGLQDGLVFKAQYASITLHRKLEGVETTNGTDLYAMALSVVF